MKWGGGSGEYNAHKWLGDGWTQAGPQPWDGRRSNGPRGQRKAAATRPALARPVVVPLSLQWRSQPVECRFYSSTELELQRTSNKCVRVVEANSTAATKLVKFALFDNLKMGKGRGGAVGTKFRTTLGKHWRKESQPEAPFLIFSWPPLWAGPFRDAEADLPPSLSCFLQACQWVQW